MCTIIGGYFKEIGMDTAQIIIEQLKEKGGDYISLKVIYPDGNLEDNYEITKSCSDYSDFLNYLLKIKDRFIIGFSRLTPEMESQNYNNMLTQPYKTIVGKTIVAHGTIPLKDFDKNIVDTEILRFDTDIETSILKVEELNGKIAMIEFDEKKLKFTAMNNGLGLYLHKEINFGNIWFSNINKQFSSTEMIIMNTLHPYNKAYIENKEFSFEKGIMDKVRLVSLFSGGLDTMASTHVLMAKHLNDNTLKSIDLLYFSWGTVAEDREMSAGYQYADHLRHELNKISRNDIQISFKVLNLKDMFKNVLALTNLEKFRIADEEATGMGEDEAEEAISYVPLRNSYLINSAAVFAENRYPNEKVQIILGANLTEGMVYADNSSSFIDGMNNMIKYAGQKTSKFEIKAPFVNDTKTRMLKEIKYLEDCFSNTEYSSIFKFPVDLAFSCYFPINGNPCNTCGSCLLRNSAIERSGFNISKNNDSIKTKPIVLNDLNVSDTIYDINNLNLPLMVSEFDKFENWVRVESALNDNDVPQTIYNDEEIEQLVYKIRG